LAQVLRDSYGPYFVFRDRDEKLRKEFNVFKRYYHQTYDQFLNPFRDRVDKKVIYGHLEVEKFKKAFSDAFYMTFYRDPVQQII